MKKLRLKQSDIGRWVTVKWDDVGRRDSLLIGLDDSIPNQKYRGAKVYEPHGSVHSICVSQIVDIRGRVNAA